MNEMIQDLDIPSKPLKLDTGYPLGYIPVSLSMGGRFNVPATVHVRNFYTAELLDISLFEDRLLMEKTITLLNSVILEKTDVATWPDTAIVELLLNIYSNFFSGILVDLDFPWDKTDIDWLEKHDRKDEADTLRTGNWVPKVTFPFSSMNTYDLPAEVKSYVSFTHKDAEGKPTFSAKFSAYPSFGDMVLIERLVEEKFGKQDKDFDSLRFRVSERSRLLGLHQDPSSIEIDDLEYLNLQLHEATKIKFIAIASLAIYLVGYNGKDVKNIPIEDKMAIVQGSNFDVSLGNKLNKKFNELNIGMDPKVRVMNPVTGEPCIRSFTFQVMDILQIIQSGDSTGYDISYDD